MKSSVRHFQKATIKEVAAQAGVSTTTVSLFVKGRENVCSQETAERIRSAITSLNYTPSALTRGLRRHASATIGVCMPHPLDGDLSYGAVFFEELWRGILGQADVDDYSLLHYPASVRNGTSCDPFLDGRVDGLLMMEHENRRSSRIVSAGMPMVLLLRSQNVAEGCSTVYADEQQTVALAMGHLWSLGHRRIAHVAGPVDRRLDGVDQAYADTPHDDIASLRLNGYRDWCVERGIYDPSLIGYAGSWSAPNAAEIVRGWFTLKQPPTAVFCANDVQASEICSAAKASGIDVPSRLSIVGVDNSPVAVNNDPPVTSIQTSLHSVGRSAVQELVRMLHETRPQPRHVITPIGGLVIRDSTVPLIEREILHI